MSVSRSGAFATWPDFFTCLKAGVSSISLRIHRPRKTRTELSRNGMRQPQARNCASSNSVISETINVAINMPMVTPAWGMLPKKPFRFSGAYS